VHPHERHEPRYGDGRGVNVAAWRGVRAAPRRARREQRQTRDSPGRGCCDERVHTSQALQLCAVMLMLTALVWISHRWRATSGDEGCCCWKPAWPALCPSPAHAVDTCWRRRDPGFACTVPCLKMLSHTIAHSTGCESSASKGRTLPCCLLHKRSTSNTRLKNAHTS
jgi:hypothetical protein